MSELLYKEEIFQLVGLCMEIHRELGKGHDEVIYKDALVIELTRAGIPFYGRRTTKLGTRELSFLTIIMLIFLCGIRYFFEAKAVHKLTDSHIKQLLNYLAASKVRVGLLANFGGDSLEWKRVIL